MSFKLHGMWRAHCCWLLKLPGCYIEIATHPKHDRILRVGLWSWVLFRCELEWMCRMQTCLLGMFWPYCRWLHFVQSSRQCQSALGSWNSRSVHARIMCWWDFRHYKWRDLIIRMLGLRWHLHHLHGAWRRLVFDMCRRRG